jgi:hypothetical protein
MREQARDLLRIAYVSASTQNCETVDRDSCIIRRRCRVAYSSAPPSTSLGAAAADEDAISHNDTEDANDEELNFVPPINIP